MTSRDERPGWFAIALLAALALSALGWQWQAAAGLRWDCACARALAAERVSLEQENAALRPATVTPAGLEVMRSDHAALPRLRQEIADVTSAVRQRKPKPPSGGPAPQTEPHALPADEWRNAGRGTPRDAFITALWAANAGDVDLLSKLLVLEPAAATAARDLFARQPASWQKQYADPRMLIAWLTAADVTFESMWIREETRSGNTATLRVLLQWRDTSRMPVFALERGASGWSLVVPPTAVAKYAAMLGHDHADKPLMNTNER